jgi:hypothetical protein
MTAYGQWVLLLLLPPARLPACIRGPQGLDDDVPDAAVRMTSREP